MHQYQNSNTETMNSMIMSSRKALVAKPTQSRRVASKATRRPVAMAGMQVLKPEKRYECLSYLHPLSDDEISRQIDYLVGNGWAPCIEFASQEEADTNQLFFAGPALYENRYWTMWKLPCSDASPEMRFSPSSRTARTSTQDTGSGLSDSTTSGSARWPASSAGSKQDLSFGSRSRLAPLNLGFVGRWGWGSFPRLSARPRKAWAHVAER